MDCDMELHVPVMLPEVLDILESRALSGEDSFFIDATLGGGGHSEAILEKFKKLRVVGFDRDAMARELASSRLSGYGGRIAVVAADFGELEERAAELAEQNGGPSLGVLFDLGVSNMQLTAPERGFSYQEDGPLDMRMDASAGIPTAADIIRESDAAGLARIFHDYGEERHAHRIAVSITRSRDAGYAPETTGELVALIRHSLPAPVQRKMGGHPARRVFQALRIAVNAELEAIPRGLRGAYEITRDGGVVIVISYHSLEDRIVKQTFKSWAREKMGYTEKHPRTVSEDERLENKKSRSAKLRSFVVEKSGKN
jgi:16S rRNA (cytosine1402-N4)-methyltransferase